MNLNDFPGRLAPNADVFAALLRNVTPAQVNWKPEPNKWSILEVINHLADEEVEDFRARVDLTLHAPEKDWPPIDPEGWVSARNYASRDLAESLARFLKERRNSIEWLSGLKSPDWDSTHTHPKFGSFRAGDMLAAWLEHDFIHIRQLLRLQREYYRSVGSEYRVGYAGDW